MAGDLGATQLARELEQWGRRVDDERGVDTNEDLRAKRSLVTQKRTTGMTEIIAALDPESAGVVASALDARVQAEWRGETADEHAGRTSAQRRADALAAKTGHGVTERGTPLLDSWPPGLTTQTAA